MEGIGHFISFEGGEGVGKSTQVHLLAERLAARGCLTLCSREPGGTPAAEIVREFLLSERSAVLSPLAQAFLFSAARIDHVDAVIIPQLSQGKWVISDRFVDSMQVYQSLEGVPQNLLESLTQIVTRGVMPEVTFLIDLPPEIGLRRIQERQEGKAPACLDRFEVQEKALQELRRLKFLELAEAERERFVILDGQKTPAEIAEEVWQIVEGRFLSKEGGDEIRGGDG